MTATLTKPTPLPVDLPAGEYTDHQINLLVACWQDAAVASKSRTDLALHLYELKQDLDSNDPAAGTSPTKSRFWSLFEAGALPYQGDKGRASIETAITAAKWLTGADFPNPLGKSLRNLAPATIVEIKNLSDDARQVVYRNLESSEFIGVAAVRLLAKVKEADVLQRLDQWVDENQGKALTPASIRKIEEVERAAQQPGRSIVDVTAYQPPQYTAEERREQAERAAERQREHQRKVEQQEVRDAIERPDREAAADLQKYHKLYADALAEALKALSELRRALKTISTIKGTIYLDELRECQGPLGFNYLTNDIQELQRAKDLLLEIVTVATSRTGPQTIDWETFTTEAV